MGNLILTRREFESVELSGGIRITIVQARHNKVRIAIQAPREVQVLRDDAHKKERGDGQH